MSLNYTSRFVNIVVDESTLQSDLNQLLNIYDAELLFTNNVVGEEVVQQ